MAFDATLTITHREVVSTLDPSIDWSNSNRDKFETTRSIDHLTFLPGEKPTLWSVRSLSQGELVRCLHGEMKATRDEQMADLVCHGLVGWRNFDGQCKRQLRGGVEVLTPSSFRSVFNLMTEFEVEEEDENGETYTRIQRTRLPIVEELAGIIIEMSMLPESGAKKSSRRRPKKSSKGKASPASGAK